MIKLSSPALLLPLLGATLGGAALIPAAANAAGGAYYRAELANAPKTGKFVARDVIWSCDGPSCGAGRGTSRPLIICASLAREAGEVKSFTVNGTAIAAEELARCNAAK
ncbi:CC_3452 family protein [Sphingopyxis sp.]|uniref:CC_3452 family protein n=1 Tax=Sphingopyxis sp. TaxID=1908224 RepID=UPI003BAAB6F3